MKFQDMLVLAKKHAPCSGEWEINAEFCIENAMQCWRDGAFESAKTWALKSLKYSVGTMHTDYIAAASE